MVDTAKTKADLAEAGRKKLLEFRNRKKNKDKKKTKQRKPKPAAEDGAEKPEPVPVERVSEADPEAHIPSAEQAQPKEVVVHSERKDEYASASTSAFETRDRITDNAEPSVSKPKPKSLSQSYSMLSDSYMSSAGDQTKSSSKISGLSFVTSTRVRDKDRDSSQSKSSFLPAEKKSAKQEYPESPKYTIVENSTLLTKQFTEAPKPSKLFGGGDAPSARERLAPKPTTTGRENGTEGFHPKSDEETLLTREKYELQRGLESQQRVIESLTKENMALTETFNANGRASTALANEVEDLREQVDTLAGAAERALEERDAAMNGSAASAERAKSLASEVIQLEERLLEARSNELKLEKQVETLQSKAGRNTNGVEPALAPPPTHVENGGGVLNKRPDEDSGKGNGLVKPIAATVAHTEAEVRGLMDSLRERTNDQTAAMARSIFSLLDELLENEPPV